VVTQEDSESQLLFDSKSTAWKEMPQPAQFDNYLAYEQALLDWKVLGTILLPINLTSSVECALGCLRLPSLSGRSLYRPKVISNERTRSSSTNEFGLPLPEDIDDFQMDEEGLLLKISLLTFQDLYKKMNSNEAANSRGQFMKLIEKRRGNADLDTKKFIFPKESWDSVLVPPEPDPSYYDSFEGISNLFLTF
jgi:hypothetical protein